MTQQRIVSNSVFHLLARELYGNTCVDEEHEGNEMYMYMYMFNEGEEVQINFSMC